MASHRASEPFRGVNCAAIPELLLESELFGSRKGAFSGAENLEGQFEAVKAGTLLLDEIGEMPLMLQAKLLRVVQEREYQPLGSSKVIPFNARLVAATLIDPHGAISAGKFRADLAERLDQFRIVLPPLRERREDILPLALHFLRARSQGRPLEISVSAVRMLEDADYPGNIRELENTMIKAIAEAAPGTIILPQHLPRDLFLPRTAAVPNAAWKIDESLKYANAREQAPIEVDHIYLGRFLRENDNNKTEAAKAAEIDRKTFTERWKRAARIEEEE
jgi:two-component system response regulator AtoC